MSTSPNLVEGREFANPQFVAVDTTSSPPILYVSDLSNNRVLAWRNPAGAANGSHADFVIGQKDKRSTGAQGPSGTLNTGLRGPTGLAVDAQGNLYVADSGNNRILRYPKPNTQPDDFRLPDLVIGQTSFSTNTANAGGISNRTLALAGGTSLFRAGIAIDGQGNLWVSDGGNHRVLRYPAASLTANGPAADLVLGQPDFTTNAALPRSAAGASNKTGLNGPSGIAIDSAGRVYAADTLQRVLVYNNPASGAPATRIVGLAVVAQGQPLPLDTVLFSPEGVLIIADGLAVVDSGGHRILRYEPYGAWPAETAERPSPAAKSVIGQANLSETPKPNRGLPRPNEASLNQPVGAALAGSNLYVADTGNHRLLVFPQQPNGEFVSAAKLLGQDGYGFGSPNLIEGRELFLNAGTATRAGLTGTYYDGAGVVVDGISDPPRLYIADTYNNRILGYRDARRVRPGDKADLVIGQDDFYSAMINSPTNSAAQLTDGTLFLPAGLAVDSQGNLFVADSGNGRVLRFARPFDQPEGSSQRANLVIGQSSFFTRTTDPTRGTMFRPMGVALTPEGNLLVSDLYHSRVLYFAKPQGGDFTNGQPADKVFGQPDFNSAGTGNATNRLNGPAQIALDTDSRLYVADRGNNRVLVFPQVNNAPATDQGAVVTVASWAGGSLTRPQSVYVSARTGEIWVTDTGHNPGRVIRFPRFDQLALDPRPDTIIPAPTPLAVTLDHFGNLLVADATNRVAIHFPGLAAASAAHYLDRALSPGMYASLGSAATLSPVTKVFDTVPMAKELADIQVLVNEKPSPIHFVAPNQINFIVPMSTPTSGVAEIQVVKPSVGQILASGLVSLAPATPSFFTSTQNGQGQIAALNQDNTINSASNPAARGTVIQMFATGQGFIPSAPEDGAVPGGELATTGSLRLAMGTRFVTDEAGNLQYSGLAPGLIGVWQLNVRIPDWVPPGPAIPVILLYNDIPSNADNSNRRISTTIAVK